MSGEYLPTFDEVQERVFGQRPKDTTEERTRLAVCKILRGQDKRNVGCGVLVCDPGINDHISKYCIITSKEVIKIENFCDGSINQVKFSKETKEICFDLKGLSKSVQAVPSAGLILIFIDANHRDFKQRCLPMTNFDQGQQPFCYLANQCYNIVKSSGENGEYVLEAASIKSVTSVKSTIAPDEIPNGTVILQGANKDVRAVGVFNVVDRNNLVVSPIWLKSSISGISDFKPCLEKFKGAADKGFEELRQICDSIQLSSLKLDEEVDYCGSEFQFDAISEGLLPADTKETGYCALKTIADGNCLFRSASIFAFGNQHRHEEMRVRTVLELALNSEFYQKGNDVDKISLAQMREIYPKGGEGPSKLSDEDVRREFESEVRNSTACNSWCGYWHLQALGTVLGRQIRSVYPDSGSNEIKKYFNAIICPRRYDPSKKPLTFMWTHTTGGDASKFRPNHFVPLIKDSKKLAASRENQKDVPKDEKDNTNPVNGEGSQATRKNDQETKALQEDKIDDTNPVKEHVVKVLVATDAEGWDTMVNHQLVAELAKNPRVVLYCYVPDMTQKQRDQAESNIKLVTAPKGMVGFTKKQLIQWPPDSLVFDVFIIHSYGRDLGIQAQVVKKNKNCKWVHVVHTISEELEKYMKVVSSTDTADPDWLPEHELQVALCEKADLVIAIGPKVTDAYKRALCHCGKHEDVITMTPGIIHDLVGVRTMRYDGKRFCVLIGATYPSKYFKVKGCDIAAKAITLLQEKSYHLFFAVRSNDSAENLKHQLKGLISLSQFTIKRVSKSIEDWKKLLCQVDLTIMPSAEGFGITGVRAISADVPVLSSGNNGFGMALKKLRSGKMHVLDSENPQDWAKEISVIRDKDPAKQDLEAKQLRKEYMREYCWRDQCGHVVDKMMMLLRKKEECDKVSVENTEKIENGSSETKVQHGEIKSAREREHEDSGVAEKNPDRMGQENEESTESRYSSLSVNVQDIPFYLLSKVCSILNKDVQRLGIMMGFSGHVMGSLVQKKNPSSELLNLWCSETHQATVGSFIEILRRLDRMDVVEILEDWVKKLWPKIR